MHIQSHMMSIVVISLMTNPNIEVANDFFHDAEDFLNRYSLTVEHFYAIKSKRMKLFLDLRMGAECILKAYAAYFLMKDSPSGDVISRVKSYRHKIPQMVNDVKSFIPVEDWQRFEPYVEQLSALPVSLRYRLDGADFRQLNENFYYATVGSDLWLDSLQDAIRKLTKALDTHLISHSRILSGADLWEEFKRPQHNKYSKKGGRDV